MTKKEALLESLMVAEDLFGIITELQMLLAVEFPVTENAPLTHLCEQLNPILTKFVEKLFEIGKTTQTEINWLGEGREK